MSDAHSVRNVLFLCTGNSARSILAECALNRDGKGRFNAFSAGPHPTGTVSPFALELLQRQDYPTDDVRSKNWDEFAKPDAPRLDFIFTVCDDAAGEVCPVWPGQPITAHWGVPDPAAVTGNDDVKRKAFNDAFRELKERIGSFLNLPHNQLDCVGLLQKVSDIGKRGR